MKRTAILITTTALFAYFGCSESATSPVSLTSDALAPSEAATAVAGTVPASNLKTGARNFRAHASGRSQNPPNDSRGQGQAIFQLSKDGTELSFKLNLANIDNVIGAHIHLGPPGQNGPIVLPFFGNPFVAVPVTVKGTLIEGVATAADVSGPIAGDLEALVEAMRSGNTYVNVHTSEFRPGEIRGTIR